MKFSSVLCFTEAERGGSLKHAIRARQAGAKENGTTLAYSSRKWRRDRSIVVEKLCVFYNSNQCIHVCTAMNNHKFILNMIIGAPDL